MSRLMVNKDSPFWAPENDLIRFDKERPSWKNKTVCLVETTGLLERHSTLAESFKVYLDFLLPIRVWLTEEIKMDMRQTPFYIDIDGFRVMGAYLPDAFRSALQYKPRDDDLFLVTFPKSGTTWTQQILYLLYTEGQPTENPMDFWARMPYIDCCGIESGVKMVRPGAIKTHLPYHMVPKSSNAKYIYVARNPKDTLVSFYHHTNNVMYKFEEGKFDDYFDLFMRGENDYGDYFEHVSSWYEHRNDPNVMLITYEEMKKNLEVSVRKIASFVDSKYAVMLDRDPNLLSNVLKYSSFEYMETKYNESMDNLFNELDEDRINENVLSVFPGLRHFQKVTAQTEKEYKLRKQLENKPETDKKFRLVRKGIIGDWKNIFSSEQAERMNEKIELKLKGTELYAYWSAIDCI